MSNKIRIKSIIRSFVFFIVVFGLPKKVTGTEYGGTAGSFLQSEIGVKAMGMGNAFTANADDGSTVFWNPACLASKNDLEFSFMHSAMFEDRNKNYGAFVIPFSRVTISGGWLRFQITDIEERDINDNLIDHFQSSENAFLFGAGFAIVHLHTFKLSLGITAKYLYNTLYEYSSTGTGMDVGTKLELNLSSPIDKIELGGVIKNIGTSVKWNTNSEYKTTIPKHYRIGMAFTVKQRGSYIKLIGETKYTENEERLDFENFNFGTELKLKNLDFLLLRAGYNSKGFNFGAGLNIRTRKASIIFNYAFTSDVISPEGIHNISAGFRFETAFGR